MQITSGEAWGAGEGQGLEPSTGCSNHLHPMSLGEDSTKHSAQQHLAPGASLGRLHFFFIPEMLAQRPGNWQ